MTHRSFKGLNFRGIFMEVLHSFEHLRFAQAFSDYLTSLEIANIIEKNEFYHQVIITDASKIMQTRVLRSRSCKQS